MQHESSAASIDGRDGAVIHIENSRSNLARSLTQNHAAVSDT